MVGFSLRRKEANRHERSLFIAIFIPFAASESRQNVALCHISVGTLTEFQFYGNSTEIVFKPETSFWTLEMKYKMFDDSQAIHILTNRLRSSIFVSVRLGESCQISLLCPGHYYLSVCLPTDKRSGQERGQRTHLTFEGR